MISAPPSAAAPLAAHSLAPETQESPLVPEFNSLAPVYDLGLTEATERYGDINRVFLEKFGALPEVYGRSPGRVNLIGEHIDYEGYGVLPMAIAFDAVVALRKSGNHLHVANLESQRFPDVRFSADPLQDVDTGHHTWANYFMCAYKGIMDHAKSTGIKIDPVGLQVMVHGNVPTGMDNGQNDTQWFARFLQGAGVSSSSAFVCSASLALLGAFGIRLTKAEVAELTCACERYVGTQSGGMDQAISIMGQRGLAKLVEFNPIRTTDVHLPQGVTFVIANSLTVSNKAETADGRYNLRVVECRLASACLAVALDEDPSTARDVKTLKDVESLVEKNGRAEPPHTGAGNRRGHNREADAQAILQACSGTAASHLHKEPYSQEEIEGILGARLQDLLNPTQLRVLPIAARNGGFKLRDRAIHVFEEALRVHRFAAACKEAAIRTGSDTDLSTAPKQKLRRTATSVEEYESLGTLMDKSHESLKELYECSCPELDELVDQCRVAGAYGSRLTGAGWGGCTVSMVCDDDVEAFVEALKNDYYAKAVEGGRAKAEEVDRAIFVSKPSSGGAILRNIGYEKASST